MKTSSNKPECIPDRSVARGTARGHRRVGRSWTCRSAANVFPVGPAARTTAGSTVQVIIAQNTWTRPLNAVNDPIPNTVPPLSAACPDSLSPRANRDFLNGAPHWRTDMKRQTRKNPAGFTAVTDPTETREPSRGGTSSGDLFKAIRCRREPNNRQLDQQLVLIAPSPSGFETRERCPRGSSRSANHFFCHILSSSVAHSSIFLLGRILRLPSRLVQGRTPRDPVRSSSVRRARAPLPQCSGVVNLRAQERIPPFLLSVSVLDPLVSQSLSTTRATSAVLRIPCYLSRDDPSAAAHSPPQPTSVLRPIFRWGTGSPIRLMSFGIASLLPDPGDFQHREIPVRFVRVPSSAG